MPISRDPDFPEEAAQLMAAMNSLCAGHELHIVEMAAANMFAITIHHGAKMRTMSREEFDAHAARLLAIVHAITVANWERNDQARDIPVRPN